MKTIIWKRHNQRGQASLEAVLLIAVGLLVTLGLVYRFNTAFKKYTIDMYGTYYRCLLETGELPGVGSVCKDKQARFAISNGRALVKEGSGSGGGGSGGSGSGGGSGGGGSGGGNGDKGGSGNKGGSGGKGSSGNQANGGGSEGGGGNSGGSPEAVGGSTRVSGGGSSSVIGRLRGLQRPKSTAVGTTANLSREDMNSSGGDPLAVNASSRAASDGLRRAQTKMDFKMDGGQYTRAETAASTSVTASPPKKGNVAAGDSLRPRKAVENMNRGPASKSKDDKSGGMDFGRLFKIFMIIGLIVGIAVFLGGQVLQISKSGEK